MNGMREDLLRSFWVRFIIYLISIAAAYTVSPTALILVTIASSTVEIWYKTSEIIRKIEGSKVCFVDILTHKDKVYESLRKIVEAAKKGDTIYVSVHEAPIEQARTDPNGYYHAINEKIKKEDITLRRLVYIAKFEENMDEYEKRIKDLKDWIEKDQKELGEEKYQVKYTNLPFFFLFIYLDAVDDKRIFQMSMPSYKVPVQHALYVKGDVTMLSAIGKEIIKQWGGAVDKLERIK